MNEPQIGFIDEKTRQAYYDLAKGKGDEKRLYEIITQALNNIKKDHTIGDSVPKRLIPKMFVKKYGINNLWVYDLPSGWRLLYNVRGEKISIVSVILDWMDHTNYERLFKY